MPRSASVIIIGGGITGVAAAYELARGGVRVLLIEQGALANMGSGRTLAGVRQSGRHPAELPLARAAVHRWSTLGEELDADLEYRQNGNLRLAEDEEDVLTIRRMVGEQKRLGLEISYLDSNAEVRDIAPSLSETIAGASFTPSDGHANPLATVQAYANAARNAGAEIREMTRATAIRVEHGRVTGVETDQGAIPADEVVVAAGIDTPGLLAPLGLHLNLSLSMVPVIQTVPTVPILDQVLGTAKAHFAARQEVAGSVRFSSGGRPFAIPPGDVTVDSMQPDAGRILDTLARAVSLIPELSGIPIRTIWGGLIDMTRDGIPVISRVDDIAGLTVAAGYCGHGFCLGPVSGEIIRDLVLGNDCAYPVEPFQWNRIVSAESQEPPELLG